MENIMYLEQEENNKKKGIIVSICAHILLLLLCLFPYLSIDHPPQQISGILVAMGTPDGGNSSEIAANSSESDSKKEDKPTEPTKNNAPKEVSKQPAVVDKAPKKVEPIKPEQKKILTEESENPIVREPSEAEKKAEAEAEAVLEAERAQKAAEEKAAQEARKAAEEKAAQEAKFNESKKQYSDLFGAGRGNNNATGNQGDPEGDPNADNLKGIAKGSGRIGGGLSDRGVIFEPNINDNSQKVGKVVIKVCVNSAGSVSEAKFTQRGSTTTDKYLIDVAEKAALKYKFTPSEVETQCGTITVDFKVGM